jgi:4-amino-4-deoxy-L-arabinose transferase-like glycosyltransferase
MWAKNIASGDLLPDTAFMKWPLYAYFLALLLKLFAENLFLVYCVQFILGVLSCLLVYAIAKKLFDRKVALIAASLYTWYGLFIFYEGLFIYVTLSLFLNALFFLSVLHIKDTPTKRNTFWIGTFLGICTLTQPNIAVFGIAVMLFILIMSEVSWQKFLTLFLTFLIGLCVITGSASFLNYVVEKDFILLSGNSGFNFYLGNNPQATGTFVCPPNFVSNQEGMIRDARIIATKELGRPLGTAEVSRFWFKRAMEFIRANPTNYLRLWAKKMMYLVNPQELMSDNEYPFVKNKISIFKILFMDLKFILPLTALGMWLGLKRLKELAPLYLIVFTLSLSITVFIVLTRYRVSALPYAMIFAAYGLVNTWEALRSRNYVRVGWLCAGVIAIAVALNFNPLVTAQKNAVSSVSSDLVSLAMEYQLKGDYHNALLKFERAYRLNPRDQFVVFSLGFAYYQLKDIDAAEDKFKEALRINPLFVDAYYNLGYIYNRESRPQEAKEMLKKALALDPKNMSAHAELALSYKLNAELRQASEEYAFVLRNLKRWQRKERRFLEKELKSLGARP